MKQHTRIITVAILLSISGAAFATNPPNPCGNHGNNCNPGNNTNGQSQTQGQSQDQGQHQGQTANGGNAAGGTGIGVGYGAGGAGGAGGSAAATGGAGGQASSGSTSGAVSGSLSGVSTGDIGSTSGAASTSGVRSDIANTVSNGSASTSSASNGDQSTAVDASSGSASGASADGSGNSQVNVDSSDRSSYSSQALFLPSLPSAPPSFAPGAMATVVAGSCGPLMAIESEEVTGTYLGLLRKHSIPLGRTDRIVPYQGGEYISRTYPDGSTRLLGHRAVRTVAVLTVSGSRQVSLGGGATGGNYGQGGAGGSSAMQRMVVQIDLEPCEAFYSDPAPVVAVVAPPAPVVQPKPRRRAPVRRAPAVCTPKPAVHCPME